MIRYTLLAMATAMAMAGCAPAKPKELSPGQAFQRAEAGAVVLIDVRRPDEWAQTGRAPGAVGITLQDEDFLDKVANATGGDRTAPVALICRSGNRSGQAADQLVEAGYRRVFNVTGGMNDWTAQSLPVAPWSAPQDPATAP